MPKPEVEEIFIALAYEVGVARTLEEAARDAAYFDIAQPLDAAMVAKIDDALKDADRMHNAVIDNVARRESMLLRSDPAHKPAYFWVGWEFGIDPKMQTMTYKDAGEVCAFIQEDSRPRRPSSPPKDRSHLTFGSARSTSPTAPKESGDSGSVKAIPKTPPSSCCPANINPPMKDGAVLISA
ncbi:hypothetical protein HYPDE_26613 [Hyphomicrobium denitrificans 1NES1]|uniref:Uncharacterized protein n=1 Tax=Hyphomicrobium denitrificans 1NES1 TaxID=670307 RepID=N0B251_9HYPH|nr:hypothetical protein [Hyphomicrobium denitrificans]AGK57003.1 hypothetical protein HYPDE_26613 [Hyphomicrobium denitrificans 1NES1]